MLKPGTFKLTAALGLLSGVGPISTDMYLPSLPELTRALGATTAQAQLTISVYLVGFAVGQLIYGPLSDRHGRQPILLAAVLLFCVASVACAASVSIEMLIAARFFQAVGGCGAIVLVRAIIRDLYEGARAGREMSIVAMVMGVTPIVAPLLGGLLHVYFGWRASFVLMALIGIEAIALVGWYMPETLRARDAETISPRSVLRSYGIVIREPSYLAHSALVVASYGGLFAWISGITFVLQDIYRLTPFGFAVAFSCGALGFITGTSVASRIVMRLGLNVLMGLGALVLAIGGTLTLAAVLTHLDGPVTMVFAFALYLAGLGFILPQATAAALMPFPERAGAASSLLGFVQQAMAAVCGVIVGTLLHETAMPVALVAAVMSWCALAIWIATRGIRAGADRGRLSGG